MPVFTDLIARSYLQYVIDGEKEIAHFYSQEFLKVSEGSNFEDIYLKATFYEKLCTEIGSLMIDTYSNVPFEKINQAETKALNNTSVLVNYTLGITIPNSINKKDFDDADKLLFEIYKNEIEHNAPNHINWQDCNNVEKLFSQVYLNNIKLKDPIVIIKPSKIISPKPLVLRKSKLEFLKTEAERAKTDNQTKKIQNTSADKNTVHAIKELFNSVNDQFEWKEIFKNEEDYNEFVDLLALNLEQKPINLPEKIFKLKRRTKTKVSAILKSIYDEISNVDTLKNSTDYFNIIKLLSHFENMNNNQIYKSLTK